MLQLSWCHSIPAHHITAHHVTVHHVTDHHVTAHYDTNHHVIAHHVCYHSVKKTCLFSCISMKKERKTNKDIYNGHFVMCDKTPN